MNFDILELILSLMAVLINLSVHEFSHGYAAYKLGDNTARNQGRLTINPLNHIDPIGTLCLVFFHFGWAKPVPVNTRNFKNPRRDFAIVALSGPISNLILAFFSSFLYLLLLSVFRNINFQNDLSFQIALNTLRFIYILHITNVGLAVFNLIPIPPLDGSRILAFFLPKNLYLGYLRIERKIYLSFIVWLFLGDLVTKALLRIPLIASNSFLSAVAGIFSLSDILSAVFSFISNLMMDFWSLIPFLRV